MKAAVTFLALVACAVAVPAPTSEEVPLSPFDWDKITPLDVFVEPINTAPVVPGQRVINGVVPPANSIPWQGYIIINSASFCGCSIISNTWFLTAAHCTISARQVQIVLGAHNRQQTETTQRTLAASGVINHANYNVGARFANDIALMRIASAMTYTNAIRNVPLAASNAGTFAGSLAVLSGWGRTISGSQPALLQRVELDILTNAVCQQFFGSSSILASTICTSGTRNNQIVGACNGDSGGPLTVNNVLAGVVSFGDATCQAGRPTAFARVSFFRNWIQQNSGV